MSKTPGFWRRALKRLNEPALTPKYRSKVGKGVIISPLGILVIIVWIFQSLTSQEPNAKDDLLWYSIILIPLLIGLGWMSFYQLKSLPSKTCNGCGERFWKWVDLCPTCESPNFTNQNDTFLIVALKDLVWVAVIILVALLFGRA